MANIYEVSNKIREKEGIFSASMLEDIFGKYEGRFDDLLDVEGLLEKIVKDLTEEDIFDGKFRDSDYSKKDWDSSQSLKGINVIPSNKKEGFCAKECIAIFSHPLREISSQPKSPFIPLINYWISCLKINEENLIIINGSDKIHTMRFLKNLITLSDSYSKGHNKQVFIVVVTKTGIELAFDYGKVDIDAKKYNL